MATTKKTNEYFNGLSDEANRILDDYPIGLPNGVEPEPLEYDLRKISQWYDEVGDKTGKEFIDLSDEEKEEFKIDKYKKK